MSWCRRCGEYEFKSIGSGQCQCKLRGHVWMPDRGEAEGDAHEVWSIHSELEFIVQDWAERKQRQDFETFSDRGDDRVVSFRPVGGAVQHFSITMEYVPSFRVELLKGEERAKVRAGLAKDARRERVRIQESRQRHEERKAAGETHDQK